MSLRSNFFFVWTCQKHTRSLSRLDTPVPMIHPGTLLTFLATVLCPPATSALGKLSRVFLPLPALIVRTLSDSASWIVFPAQVSHHNSGPILHVLAMMSNGELFDQGENIKIVRQEVFFLLGIARGWRARCGWEWVGFVGVEEVELGTNLEFGDKMGLLKVGS